MESVRRQKNETKQHGLVRSRSLGGALVLSAGFFLLTACATTDPELLKNELEAQPTASSASKADYTGEIQLAVSDEISARGKTVPYTLNAGLSSVTATRLGFRGLLDLQEFQANAPEILSGPIEEGCTLNVVLNLNKAAAEGDLIALLGTVDVKLYRCRDEKAEGIEGRGIRLISTTIGVAAAARANIRGQCVHLDLADVVFQPTGFIGGLSNIFGLTERVEEAVLAKAEEFTAAKSICPKMPPELSSLRLVLEGGGTREIGNGGIGVTLSGSIDTSAATMMELLNLMKSRGIVGGSK